MIINRLLISGLVILLIGCKADDLTDDTSLNSRATPTGVAAPLSNSEFQNLAPEKQYQVANKLASTLYQGVPVDEFFDFNVSGNNLKVSDAGNQYLRTVRMDLITKLKNKANYTKRIESRHNLGTVQERAKALPLAILTEYPSSRERFEVWMVYVLMNTILFSPAEELDSANYIDIQSVFNNLVLNMNDDTSIRSTVLAHMKSQSNWRRFRSPEDNTREMIEIYLGLFDRDTDVSKAAVACKNWSLTAANDEQEYTLVVDLFTENVEPQKILDRWATTCDDFYDVVSNHPLLIPQVASYLVEWFFPEVPAAKRGEIVKDIVAKNPVRFHDIFTAIIFSREYLIENEKPKSFEDNFFNLAERLNWEAVANSSYLRDLAADANGTGGNIAGLAEMGQPTMTLKLGRAIKQPLDPLRFSYYHNLLREQLLTKVDNDLGSWGDAFVNKGDLFDTDEYINYLFLSVLSRQATEEELTVIKEVFVASNNESGTDYRMNQARIVFDYISRLPDLYYYKTIKKGEAQ